MKTKKQAKIVFPFSSNCTVCEKQTRETDCYSCIPLISYIFYTTYLTGQAGDNRAGPLSSSNIGGAAKPSQTTKTTSGGVGAVGTNRDQTGLGGGILSLGGTPGNIGGPDGVTWMDSAASGLGPSALASNSNDGSSDLLGLGGLLRRSAEPSRRNFGGKNPLGLEDVAGKGRLTGRGDKHFGARDGKSLVSRANRGIAPSFPSSRSSSSSSLSSPSSMFPSLSSSASSASSSSSSAPLLSGSPRIPGSATSSATSEVQGSRGVAMSWSLARSSGQPGSRQKPSYGSISASRSLFKDVGLDKSRVFYNNKGQPSATRSTRRTINPLGLDLSLSRAGRSNLPAQLRQGETTQDATSYSATPVRLARPRYHRVADASRRSHTGVGSTQASPEPPSLGALKPALSLDTASAVLPSRYNGLGTSAIGRNSGVTSGYGETSSFLTGQSLSSRNQQRLYLRNQRNQQQQQLRLRQQQSRQQEQQQQRLQHFGSQQQHRHHSRPQQHQGHIGSGRLHQRPVGMQQIQRHTQRAQSTQRTDPGADITRQVLDNIEVKATPARRLTPGGPLRIGLDINVRHGVYPIEALKQA